MKFALTRELVLHILKQDEAQEDLSLCRLSDIQLYQYFVDAQYLTEPDECIGIVKTIPEGVIDGKEIYEDIGIPLDLDYYLNGDSESNNDNK